MPKSYSIKTMTKRKGKAKVVEPPPTEGEKPKKGKKLTPRIQDMV